MLSKLKWFQWRLYKCQVDPVVVAERSSVCQIQVDKKKKKKKKKKNV